MLYCLNYHGDTDAHGADGDALPVQCAQRARERKVQKCVVMINVTVITDIIQCKSE